MMWASRLKAFVCINKSKTSQSRRAGLKGASSINIQRVGSNPKEIVIRYYPLFWLSYFNQSLRGKQISRNSATDVWADNDEQSLNL